MRALRNMALIAMMFFLGCIASASESPLVLNPTFVACGAIIAGVIFAIADMIYEERR